MMLEILTVAGLPSFEIYAAIPTGFVNAVVIFYSNIIWSKPEQAIPQPKKQMPRPPVVLQQVFLLPIINELQAVIFHLLKNRR